MSITIADVIAGTMCRTFAATACGTHERDRAAVCEPTRTKRDSPMPDNPAITEDDIRKARMRLTLSLDGDTYTNTYQCEEYPELTRLDTGPNTWNGRKGVGQHDKRYFVGGEPVDRSYEAIAASINACRAVARPAGDMINEP